VKFNRPNQSLSFHCISRNQFVSIHRLHPSAGALLFVTFSLPVFDELCRRSMNFVHSCLSHDSYLIRFVADYAVVRARSQSFLGHNVLFCAHRYNFSVNICNRLSSFDNLVKSFLLNSIDDNMRCFANLLYELIMIRERRL